MRNAALIHENEFDLPPQQDLDFQKFGGIVRNCVDLGE